MQRRKKTNSSYNNRLAQKGNELYGQNLCALLFFFFFSSCLMRIFVYLRFPGGNWWLSVCFVRVSYRVRERASERPCEQACQYATCRADELCLEEDYSRQVWERRRCGARSSALVVDLFVSSFNLLALFSLLFWRSDPEDEMSWDPPGFWTLS